MSYTKIDLRHPAGIISPLLFGHNLEHTRSAIWRGLSAQMLANRKFAGGPSTCGVARPWYPIGEENSWFSVRRTLAPVNHQEEAYVQHHSLPPSETHWDSSRQRQMIAGSTDNHRRGIGQSCLDLAEGREYEGRVVLRADRDLEVRVAVLSGDAPGAGACSGPANTTVRETASYHQQSIHATDTDWSIHEFRFIAPESDANACLEITFTGPGILYVGATALLPVGHFHGMRRDVVELLKEISSPILRWPGGNFAGSYIWKDGLLPVDRRAPVNAGIGTLSETRGWDDHEIGTDEFIALCREIDAEPWITINMSRGGSSEMGDDARDWVEYCNGSIDTKWGAMRAEREAIRAEREAIRAERGQGEPYGVTYWSLGNEMGYGHMGGPNAPVAYGVAADTCAQKMRDVDSRLILVASGTWWKEEWFPAVLPKYGHQYDHISFHEYTDPMDSYWGDVGREEFRRVATDSERLSDALELVRKRLDVHSPKGKHIDISFDEWNTWHNWFRKAGIADGIYAASILSMLCRESARLGITIGAFFEPVNEGAITVRSHSSMLTPIGMVHRLFRGHHGRRLIRTDPVTAENKVVIVTTVDDTGGDVFVSVVNRSVDESSRVQLAITGTGEPITDDDADAIGDAGDTGRLTVKGAILLTSSGYEPGSQFHEQELGPVVVDGRRVSFTLPKHSVCSVRLELRQS